MNNLLMWVAGTLALVLATLFAVPPLVDWNQYRGVFEEEVSRLLGREVRVGGRVNLRILPVPYVGFEKVSVADAPGIPGAFLRAERFTMLLSVPPLLRGVLEARKLEIDQPVVRLRFDEQGGGNWQSFEIRQHNLAFVPNDISLQSAQITEGRLTIETHLGDEIANIADINGEFIAGGLNGPFKFTGAAALANQVHEVRLATAKSNNDGLQFKASATAQKSGAKHSIDGQLTALSTSPVVSGQLVTRAPIPLKSPATTGNRPKFDVRAGIQLTPQMARLSDMIVSFDTGGRPQQLTGELQATWDSGLRLKGALSSKWLDLDAITNGATQRHPLRAFDLLSGGSLDLGAGGAAQLDFSLDQISLGGEVASNLALRLVQRDADLRIDRLSVSLPGRTRLRADGTLRSAESTTQGEGHVLLRGASLAKFLKWANADKIAIEGRGAGAFEFTGRVTVQPTAVTISKADARFSGGTLQGDLTYDWSKAERLSINADVDNIDVSGIGPDILAPQNIAAALGLGSTEQSVKIPPILKLVRDVDLELRLRASKLQDSSRTVSNLQTVIRKTGRTVEFGRTRLTFEPGLDLEVEGQVDASKPAFGWSLTGTIATREAAAIERLQEIIGQVAGKVDFEDRLDSLFPLNVAYTSRAGENDGGYRTEFDADGSLGSERLRLAVTSGGPIASWASNPMTLTLKVDGRTERTIATLLGTRDPPQSAVAERNASVAKAIPSFVRLTLAGNPSKGLAATAHLSSHLWRLRLQAKGQSAAQDQPLQWAAHGHFELPVVADALSVIAPKWLPLFKHLPSAGGAFELKHDPTGWTVNPVEVLVGGSAVSGTVKVAAPQERNDAPPSVSGRLFVNVLDGGAVLAPLLASNPIERDRQQPPPEQGQEPSFWTDKAFDFDALSLVNADLTIASPKLALAPGVNVRDTRAEIRIKSGILEIAAIRGNLLGGKLSARGKLVPKTAGAQAEISVRLERADLARLVAGQLSKRLDGGVSVSLTASGQALSPSAMIAALRGKGKVQLLGATVPGIRIADVTAVADRIVIAEAGPNDLKGLIASQVTRSSVPLGRREVPFAMRDGALQVADIKVASPNGGSLRNRTTVDVLRLMIDSEWEVDTKLARAIEEGIDPTKTLPPIRLVYIGKLSELALINPQVGTGDLQRELTVRRMELDVSRLERLRREDEARGKAESERLRREERDRQRAIQNEIERRDGAAPPAIQPQTQGAAVPSATRGQLPPIGSSAQVPASSSLAPAAADPLTTPAAAQPSAATPAPNGTTRPVRRRPRPVERRNPFEAND
ncbi:MAG: AsmA family protein [Hyphomicrobiaceae bacterium]